ncbi:Ger(x)C family spore germination C-terminal domain-containing protein [Ammoniphilus sp. 3BR4]|uniref:Ger(x)C family spore germination C-terminal domain-containing protein n=1 Tax=Ammoniphilus sp. 3BR4 TaxID=3158265 RepID=UPI0034674A4E
MTVKPDKEKKTAVTVRINQANSELIPKIENGKWKMTVHLEMRGDMIQNETHLNMMDPKLSHLL